MAARRQSCAQAPGEYVGVLFVLGGREVLEQDGRQVELRGGEIAVWDFVRPARFSVLEPLSKLTLLIPRARLATLHPHIERTTVARRQRSQATALLLSEHVQAAANAASLLERVGARAAAAAAVELLAAAPEPARRPTLSVSQAALIDTVDAYIERHLDDPALSPATIADAHSVSVRTVHALIHKRGESVAAYPPPPAPLPVRPRPAIDALDHQRRLPMGVHRLRAFSRAFREQYDESPRGWHSRVSAENEP